MGNALARLIALCGLTQQEAADFLGLAKRTVAMKATNLRRPTEDELRRVAGLWTRIRDGSLDDADPAGARERRIALEEAEKSRRTEPTTGAMEARTMFDPHAKRRRFIFVHRVVRAIGAADYAHAFRCGLLSVRRLMSDFARLLLESDAIARKRVAVLRRRGLLPPRPVHIPLRDRMGSLFPLPTPTSTAPA